MSTDSSCPFCHGSGGDLYFDADRSEYLEVVRSHAKVVEYMKAKALSLRLVYDVMPPGPEKMVVGLERDLSDAQVIDNVSRWAIAEARCKACCRDAFRHMQDAPARQAAASHE